MPIYQYKCPHDGSEQELLQPMGAGAPKCKKCKRKMERHYSGSVGLAFKGGGFHKTDYPSLGGSKGNPVMTVRNKSDNSPDRRAKPKSIRGVEEKLQ